MFDVHGFALFLLWLLAAAGVVLFVRWLNQFLEGFELERDTRLLAIIAFTGVVLFGVLNFLWDVGSQQQKSPMQTNKVEVVDGDADITDVDVFIQAHHPTLYDFRSKLQSRRKALQSFFENVRQLAQDSPHMQDFLQEVVDIRWDTQEDMFKTEKGVNLSLQEFWIYHSTGEKAYVNRMFSDIADKLVDKIKDSLAFDAEQLGMEQKKIQAMLKNASQQLDNNGIPSDPKNRRKSLAFGRYEAPNITFLRGWLLKRNQPGIVAQIDKLLENQQEIQRKAEKIQTFLKQPPSAELRKAMGDVVEEWKNTSRYNQYSLYQILYAAELLYVLEKITGKDEVAEQPETLQQAKQLWVHLQQTAPVIADLAWRNRTEGVERSYNPGSFF